ncbi:MAG: phytanoyl-CoA dioxygenase family protein [Ignavibacteriales bacterium]|nr:phytanoyl-CoA dioxygenase family protein [Ignavibacteriales bacterium]
MARAFVFAKRFAGIAAQLMQVQGVRLYHDQALFKQYGGLPTPWHQDQFYWPVSSKNMLTMWMPLTDCPREMGSMTFAKGSHLRGQLSSLPISSTSNDFFRKHITEQQYELETFDLRAGDVTFHSGWTLHCAGANNTLARRDVMTIIYYEDGAKVSVPVNSYQQVDMEAFFPGCKPGDAAATQLNPLIHSTKGKLTNS